MDDTLEKTRLLGVSWSLDLSAEGNRRRWDFLPAVVDVRRQRVTE